ncbi:hypothetical protein PoB_000314700 [Plakobranchus ocellatus]|uniref:Uncharacterized protein n=1 Tax=Plakobranchus ocellatus TaxID=259542 RepID=A0AAV3Y3I4_9GAST|nr:hypothetical protein PoB_000314700 [Plakobranchus ocellatus]
MRVKRYSNWTVDKMEGRKVGRYIGGWVDSVTGGVASGQRRPTGVRLDLLSSRNAVSTTKSNHSQIQCSLEAKGRSKRLKSAILLADRNCSALSTGALPCLTVEGNEELSRTI